jgi:hypothetical protein
MPSFTNQLPISTNLVAKCPIEGAIQALVGGDKL